MARHTQEPHAYSLKLVLLAYAGSPYLMETNSTVALTS
jgi:hypothetical protein